MLLLTAALAAFKPTLIYVDSCLPHSPKVEKYCEERGCGLVKLYSVAAAQALINEGCTEEEECEIVIDRVPLPGDEIAWRDEYFSDVDVVGVLCTSDAGLADAERLQHLLVPERSNGMKPARRDKWAMVEAMRSAGLAASDQAATDTWEELKAFLDAHDYPVVLKPRRGQASILVGLAHDEAQARGMQETLGSFSSFVSLDGCNVDECSEGQCVVQEFLRGTEYIVDTVSADGEHKCLGFWRYAKGPENGAPFVYHCDELKAVDSEVERAVIEYAFAALDALEWKWGTCHLEIMWAEGKGEGGVGSGAALIEANMGRWNGDDFSLIARTGTGYEAVQATLDAYLDADAWAATPTMPPAELRGHGRLVHLVSSVAGTLRSAPAEVLEREPALPSLVRFEPVPSEAGEEVVETVDLNTRAGIGYLLHGDAEVVAEDYRALRGLQPTLFEVD